MFCIECGKSNPDKAKFCAFCGSKLYIGEDSEPKPAIIFPSVQPDETVPEEPQRDTTAAIKSTAPHEIPENISQTPEDDVPPWEEPARTDDKKRAEDTYRYTHVSIGAYDTETDPQTPSAVTYTPEAARADGYTGSPVSAPAAEHKAEPAQYTGRHAPKTPAAPVQSETPYTAHADSYLNRPRTPRAGTIVPAAGENPAQPSRREPAARQVSADIRPAQPAPVKTAPVVTEKAPEPVPEQYSQPVQTVRMPLNDTSSKPEGSGTLFFDDDDEDFGAKSKEAPLFDRIKAMFTRPASDTEEDPFAEEEEIDEEDELESAIESAPPRRKARAKIIYDDDDDDTGIDDDDGDGRKRSPRSLLGSILGGGNDEVLTSTGTQKLPARAHGNRRDTHIPEMITPRRRTRADDVDDTYDDAYIDDEPKHGKLSAFIMTGIVVLAMCVCLWLFATQSGGEFLAGLNMSDNAQDYYHLGNTARANGQIKRAADAYYSALCLDNDNYDIALLVGITQQQIGEYDKAIKAYYLCTTLDSEKPEPYMYLIKLYTAMGDTASAESFRRLGQQNTISAMFDD